MQATRTIILTPDRVARFWSNVDRRTPGECWPWIGEKHSTGHGIFSEWSGNRRTLKFYAHRLSLLIAGEDIEGRVVRHDCDNRPCVNPAHLRTGTQAANMQDAIDRGRLDTSGLAICQSPTWPPRPCRRCGAVVTEGRRRYCPPCRTAVTNESNARYRAKKAEATA